MGCTVKHMLLLFVIIQHIGGMYSINCPTYEKHELLRKGLLNHKSICRAIQYGLEEKICLNGLKPVGSDCNTGHCLFNIWCTGVCFTGDHYFVNEEYDFDIDCDKKFIILEHEKLCDYYLNLIKKDNEFLNEEIHGAFEAIAALPKYIGQAFVNVFTSQEKSKLTLEYMMISCVKVGYKLSEIRLKP